MTTSQRWMAIALLALFWALVAPLPAQAAERVITGELVVLKGSANNFRIVGHDGSFTAPAGTPLYELDGKNVEVELSGNRVQQIVERPVAIDRIQHGFETVRGEVVVTNAAARTFTFASGDGRVYVAPASIDIAPYAGKMVEATLDEDGRVTEIKLVGVPPQGALPPSVPTCDYQGDGYSHGATVCQAGSQFRCENGIWRNLGLTCQAAARVIEPPPASSCMFGGATVASGSSICREGTTYRCSNGAWMNLTTACR